MENQNKSNYIIGGVDQGRRGKGSAMVATPKSTRTIDFLLRILALCLTLVAAIVLGVDKETQVVPITLVPTLPPLDVPVSAKWHYLSAFTYFVVANSIACAYAALSLLLSLINRRGQGAFLAMFILFMDILMIALLFSSNGAALAIGLMGYKGNSHVQWKKVCNVFGRFCNHAAASIVVSLLGSGVFILLVLSATLSLHRRSK